MKTVLLNASTSLANDQVLTSDALAKQNDITVLQYPLSFNDHANMQHTTALAFYFTKRNKAEVATVEALRRDALTTGKFTEQLNALIMLPFPHDGEIPILQVNNDVGGSGGALADMFKDFGNLIDTGGGIGDFIETGWEHIKAEVATKGSKAVNNAMDTGTVTQGRERGNAYSNTKRNTLSLSYRFYPRSATELKALGQIISTIAILASARSGGVVNGTFAGVNYTADQSLSINVPGHVWIEEISLRPDSENTGFTPRLTFGPAQIQSFRVYQPAEYSDARFAGTTDPVCYQLNIELTEIAPRFAEDIELNCKNLGVNIAQGAAGYSQFSSPYNNGI